MNAHAGFRDALVHARALFRRNVLRMARNQSLLFFTITQPAMFVVLFYAVFSNVVKVPRVVYVDFFVPGVAAQSVTFMCGGTAVGLAEDKQRGVMDRFRSMPVARSSVLLGRIGADAVRMLVTAVIVFAVGTLVGFRFHSNLFGVVAVFVILVLWGVALSIMAANIGLLAPNAETAQAGLYSWLYPATFFSSAFVPAAAMTGWAQVIARNNPLTFLINGVRAVANGKPAGVPLTKAAIASLVLVIVFTPLAVWQFNRRLTR
ncbi:MAG: ABC transporter permease [Acidimicrobiia bacterium]